MSSKSLSSVQKPALVRPAVMVASWYRGALGAILLLSAALNVFQLDRVGLGNTYYSTAVKSMTQSWHNFFFVAFDPGAFVTVDKPPVAFWIQAASVKLFGFSGLSLILPEAIAGVLSVWLLYSLVSRSFGRPAGLLSALALAITPVAVLVDRSNLVEGILVLTLILAAGAVIRATETGSLRWLLLGFALADVGFNVKMLEAYLAVPALFLMYFLGASIRWRTRIVHLILGSAMLLIVSLIWVTAVDLTPANQRPYVASSGNNSELNLALGYNGLGRLTGNTFSFLGGGATVSSTLSDLSPTNLGFSQGETGGPGVQRLVNAELGGQTSWLLMLAVIGFLVASWRRLPRFPLDRRQGSLVLWGARLLTGGAFFSIAGTFHAYYLATHHSAGCRPRRDRYRRALGGLPPSWLARLGASTGPGPYGADPGPYLELLPGLERMDDATGNGCLARGVDRPDCAASRSPRYPALCHGGSRGRGPVAPGCSGHLE